jgi:hypothetical protein
MAKLGAAALILCVVIRFWISGWTTTLITAAVIVAFIAWISITQSRSERRGPRRDGPGGDSAYVAGSTSGGHHSHGSGDFSGGGDFGGDSGGGDGGGGD